jgi:hypothetical protein
MNLVSAILAQKAGGEKSKPHPLHKPQTDAVAGHSYKNERRWQETSAGGSAKAQMNCY